MLPQEYPQGIGSLGLAVHGVTAGPGNSSTIPCAPRDARRQDATNTPPLAASIAKGCRRPHAGGSGAARKATMSKVANDLS